MPRRSRPLSPQSSALSPRGNRPSARRLAFRALLEIERTRGPADEVVSRHVDRPDLDLRERSLAFELVYGVLRQRTMLDWRLTQVTDRSLARLPLIVLTALRVAAYQLLCLDRVPSFAAVNESVQLVKSTRPGGSRDWSGFVNAVLRALVSTPAPQAPDPAQDPVPALSLRYSMPTWLVQRWLERFGLDRTARLCEATTTVPPLTLRVNSLRGTRNELIRRLNEAGYRARPTLVSPAGVLVASPGPARTLPFLEEGAFYIEDEAGQLVAPILDPQPGERILDACAAPGGKATHLTALMGNTGTLVALDRSRVRLLRLLENARRLGVRIIHPIAADATQAPFDDRILFDRILVDAPCSGLGVLRRHPEGKWRKAPEDLPGHRETQLHILSRTSRLLRPGGVLVYSTCSTESEENEGVIAEFCRTHAGFEREPVTPWIPSSARTFVTPDGYLYTTPTALPNGPDEAPAVSDAAAILPVSLDTFFVARLRKAKKS